MDIKSGMSAFQKNEPRDGIYKTATFLIEHFWGEAEKMADALGVLLLTWNMAFYRYGSPDFGALERTVGNNLPTLERYRERSIVSLNSSDEAIIRNLFSQFLDALKVSSGKNKGRRSPVAVAKALHLLAPSFFALWDKAIAGKYGRDYSKNPETEYLLFMKSVREIAVNVQDEITATSVTIVKAIDEYNYSKFTKEWI